MEGTALLTGWNDLRLLLVRIGGHLGIISGYAVRIDIGILRFDRDARHHRPSFLREAVTGVYPFGRRANSVESHAAG